MPDPTIQGAARLETVPRLYHRAQWGDAWVHEPRAKVIRASRSLAPRIGDCDFIIHFNEHILQPGGTVAAAYLPIDLTGHFVKITSQKQGQPENRDWTGIVVDSENSYKSNVALRGVQRLKAFGLEHLLYREIIHKAWIYHNSAEVEIDWAPSFNLRGKQDRGERQIDPLTKELLGNAHADFTKFEREFRWNAWKAIQYLVDRYPPGGAGMPWALKGQYESLGQWEDVWPQNLMSFGAILDSIISRKLGYTWYVDCYDFEGSEFLDIRVQTMFGTDFTVGSQTIPANDRQQTYFIPTAIPQRHIFGSPVIHYSTVDRYKNIIIQGNRIKVLGTWSLKDETLTEGWTLQQEDIYRICPGVPDVTVTDPETGTPIVVPDVIGKDAFRASELMTRVFSAFVVPYPFLGELGDGIGGPKEIAIPVPDDNGEVDFVVDPAGAIKFYQLEKRFSPMIPLLKGFDYSKGLEEDGFDTRPFGTDTDYREMLLLFQDPYKDGSIAPAPNEGFVKCDKMGEKQKYLHPSSVAPLKKEFGIQVRCSPNHHNACVSPDSDIDLSMWGDGDPIPDTQHAGLLDYQDMILTAFVEMDQRPRIVIEQEEAVGAISDLVVTVKSVEYWFALANTVVDVDAEGFLLTINPDHAVPNALRRDKELLETIAAVVSEWFQIVHRKVRIPVDDVGYGESITPELGVFLQDIQGILLSGQVNSVASHIELNYREGASYFETDFLSLSERIELVEMVMKLNRLEISFETVSSSE